LTTLDKFRALYQHRESAAGETQIYHVGRNAKIQVSSMYVIKNIFRIQ